MTPAPFSLHLPRARLALFRVAGAGGGDEGAAGERGDAGECDVGRVAVAACEREIFAQRVKWVAVPHEDAAEMADGFHIGMAGESDAHHVEHFALVPVGGRPQIHDARRGRVVLAHGVFQPQVFRTGEVLQFIDHLVARLFAEVIHAADINEIRVAELVAEECGDVVELRAVHSEREFAAKFFLRDDGKFFGERGGVLLCGCGDGEGRGHWYGGEFFVNGGK